MAGDLTEAELKEINAILDRVVASRHGDAIDWLRAAFHAHEAVIARLRHKIAELRDLALSATIRPLTVPEARLLGVCRLCRLSYRGHGGDFVLNFGEEFAHGSCLPLAVPKYIGEGI